VLLIRFITAAFCGGICSGAFLESIITAERREFMPISSGIPAPDFELYDDTDTLRKLSDFRGKNIILYFYPKDDTPGCTTEACNFRDDYSAYEKAGVVILGVSPDNVKSHVKFKQKFDLSPSRCLRMRDTRSVNCTGFGDRRNSWGNPMKAC
jgi:hypothetical protein